MELVSGLEKKYQASPADFDGIEAEVQTATTAALPLPPLPPAAAGSSPAGNTAEAVPTGYLATIARQVTRPEHELFRVGDVVKARSAEDSLLYEGVIVSIGEDATFEVDFGESGDDAQDGSNMSSSASTLTTFTDNTAGIHSRLATA